MAASTTVPLTPKSQAAFISYYKSVQSSQNTNRLDLRGKLEDIDRAYQRELDRTEANACAEAANAAGDISKFKNITVPVVMPQIESAVQHQSAVYLTERPLFPVVADPEFIDQAMQLESILENQSIRGGWTRELLLFFRDGFKYNYSAVEATWEQEVTYAVETDLQKSKDQGIAKEVIWSGNTVTRLDPYNTFCDTRVPASEVYKDGEYAGYTRYISRIKLKSFISELPDKIIANIVPAFESGVAGPNTATDMGAMNYFIPDINTKVNESDKKNGSTNWLSWAGLSDASSNRKIDYKDAYELTTIYCKILPSEFDLKIPKDKTPQIYKLHIVNHQHIIYAELQTNAHGMIPIFFGQPHEDGLSYQTKSLADNAKPFQDVTTAYMTSILESRRRAITDRVLYDPSRITNAHINSPNPSAKIPVRPAAYGSKISDSVYAFPYREDQAGVSMQQISALLGLSNNLAGQNQVSQGQFQKGNKTQTEFETVMRNSTGSDQLYAILYESQVFTPMKHVLKINILQFQGGVTIYNPQKKAGVTIDPIQLRKAILEFKVGDGLVPASKLINSDSFSVALQAIGSSPQIGGAYNIGQLFSYMMKTQGADIDDFEKSPEQVAYEQAVGSWQAMMSLALEKDKDPATIGPQPTPEQFGYAPANNKPAPESEKEQPQSGLPSALPS